MSSERELNQDVLGHMAQWLSAESTAFGVMAMVSKGFNTAFQEEATEIGDERRYALLRAHVTDDLVDNHGFFEDPENDDYDEMGLSSFVHCENPDVYVHLYRGPEPGSVMFSSGILGWSNLVIRSKEEWDAFSPWASLEQLVELF
jgi:hypothetical protein